MTEVEKALCAIDELAFQMVPIMDPASTHPNIGAIRDWCQKALALLAHQSPASEATRPEPYQKIIDRAFGLSENLIVTPKAPTPPAATGREGERPRLITMGSAHWASALRAISENHEATADPRIRSLQTDIENLVCEVENQARQLAAAEQRVEALQRERDKLDRDFDQALEERDNFHEWADKLAYRLFDVEDIGEHSSMNNPWQKAVEALDALSEERDSWKARAESAEATLKARDTITFDPDGTLPAPPTETNRP